MHSSMTPAVAETPTTAGSKRGGVPVSRGSGEAVAVSDAVRLGVAAAGSTTEGLVALRVGGGVPATGAGTLVPVIDGVAVPVTEGTRTVGSETVSAVARSAGLTPVAAVYASRKPDVESESSSGDEPSSALDCAALLSAVCSADRVPFELESAAATPAMAAAAAARMALCDSGRSELVNARLSSGHRKNA
jgi:hypothetical protein